MSQNVTKYGDRIFTNIINLNVVLSVGPNPIWLVSLKKGETWKQVHTEGGQCEARGKRQPSPSQGERWVTAPSLAALEGT